MDDIIEQVWYNYKEGEGPCNQCPNRDKSHNWTPFYGGGSTDANVAFIAITPGGDRDQQIGNEKDIENIPENIQN